MEFVVSDSGEIDWRGYELLTTRVPLRDFLDLVEVSIVSRDRKGAWEDYLRRNPNILSPGGGVGHRPR